MPLCRYMLAWGNECGTWHGSVDEANLERYDYEDMPDEELVMKVSFYVEAVEKAQKRDFFGFYCYRNP
jgi:hypothetical protein